MAAVLTDIADAVRDELNSSSRTWSQAFVAVRQNIPRVSRENLTKLSVIVAPKSRLSTPFMRTKSRNEYEIAIGVQKALSSDANEQSDPLVALCESIAEYFDNGLTLANYAAACTSAVYGAGDESPWMAVTDSEQMLLFTGVIVLTFLVVR